MLLEIRKGSVSRDGEMVLSHFDFEIKGTEKIALVGRNGAGKTTLLEVIAGIRELDSDEKTPDSGLIRSRAFTVGMLNQQAVQTPEMTVEESVLQDALSEKSIHRGEEMGEKLNAQAAELYSRERFDYEQRYDRMFTGFGFSKEDKVRKLGEFSGGEQTKISMIRLLLAAPDILILDEPTNHLDMAAVEWLEKCVSSYPKAVVMVSHDRYFIDRTADLVWEITGGKTIRYPGSYSRYREQKLSRYRKQLAAYERQQEEIRSNKELIERFKHKPRKAAFARSRKKILERMELVEKPVKDDAVIHTGEILPSRPGSKWVFECEDMCFGFDQPLARLSFRLRRGQKIGIIGPNGSGKSTFLKTVAGQIPALSGKGGLGQNIDPAYYDQMISSVFGSENILTWFGGKYPSLSEKEIRDILAGYLFSGKDMGKKVSNLSGGEKARLLLASLLQGGPNLLILDEPTNNMDIPAKETLESIFKAYKGSMLFVSHDRYFLSKVADALLIFEGRDQPVRYYPFGYDHYKEHQRQAPEGMDAAAVRAAEEQKMIEGLKAVPKGERHRLREISQAQAELDWRFSNNREEREMAKLHCRECAMALSSEKLWFDEKAYRKEEADLARWEKRWTESCLAWYELWQDSQGLPEEE